MHHPPLGHPPRSATVSADDSHAGDADRARCSSTAQIAPSGQCGERIDDSVMLVFNSIRLVIWILRNRHARVANEKRQFRKAAFDTIVHRQWRRPTCTSFVKMSFNRGSGEGGLVVVCHA